MIGCGSEDQTSKYDTESDEIENETEMPTSAEIEQKITDANFCDVADDCGFVHVCWCGAVANTDELESLQSLIDDWLQDPGNAENCASTDCVGFAGISCDQGVCVAIEEE